MLSVSDIRAWLEGRPKLTSEQIIARGHRADRLMNDETFKEVMGDLKARNLQSWSATGGLDTGKREQYWLANRCLEDITTLLRSYSDSGKLEKAKIEKKQRSERNSIA